MTILSAIVAEAIEIDAESKVLSSRRSGLMKDAKQAGFDPKIVRQSIKLKEMDQNDRDLWLAEVLAQGEQLHLWNFRDVKNWVIAWNPADEGDAGATPGETPAQEAERKNADKSTSETAEAKNTRQNVASTGDAETSQDAKPPKGEKSKKSKTESAQNKHQASDAGDDSGDTCAKGGGGDPAPANAPENQAQEAHGANGGEKGKETPESASKPPAAKSGAETPESSTKDGTTIHRF